MPPSRRIALLPAFALALAGLTAAPATSQEAPPDAYGDATVIAVIDSGIAPYHWDFSASRMPQAQDEDPDNDLPLDQPPDAWLKGFPSSDAFASYNRLDLTLDDANPRRSIASLSAADNARWNTVRRSTPESIHYYWMPHTKVIGGLTFSSSGRINAASNTHGQGTASVSVGNLYGTCAECLLVFIQYGSRADGEEAIEWALSQPWIDAISNSYGFSAVERERIYSGSNTEAQRTASERGQTVLFSAGNGISNTFTIPNTTLFSSQEGPDWMVTVGAVGPSQGASYTGHGKPADISSVGGGYPSAYTSSTVSGSGSFGGTSNATPVIAGVYGRALHEARRALPGPSRLQGDGVIATAGEGTFDCREARPDCELGDGVLTATELRTRLFHGAVHTPAGMTVSSSQVGNTPPIGEDEFINEGHGTYFGKLRGAAAWDEEFERILGPLEGRAPAPQRPAGEREWMIVDSFCRQEIWGDWRDGYFVRGQTALPGPSPMFPVRSALEQACPHLFPPL
ncbi:MAG: S8 family serine peptidase [Actinomycetota bacterium]|nr:S8 family serine peptidase [Actinomycetota bacterium]